MPASTALDRHLADVLLVQIDAGAYADAIECSDRAGGGIVLTGEKALAAAEYVLDHRQYGRPVLIDRSRYSGKSRRRARDSFDPNWISRQRRLGLPVVLPDAGYVGRDDEVGLVSILTRVANLGPGVVAPLPLHPSWLNAKVNLPRLIEHIQVAGVPVAVALEHQSDPLSARYAFDGLMDVLKLPVPVILLRSDVSAIGALCFGATAAAVGTKSSLRHIYPVPKEDSFGRRPTTAAVVKGCLAYASLDKIALAVQVDREDLLWTCDCPVCAGQTLDWLGSAPDSEAAASLHSLETLYRIRRALFGHDGLATAAERRQVWIAQCSSARFEHLRIERATAHRWVPPPALDHWARHTYQEVNQPSTS